MPKLDARGLAPEVHVDLTLEQVAGALQDALCPEVTPIPLVVAALEDVVDPAEARLSADPFESRVAVQDAGEDEVGNELGLRGELSRGPYLLALVARVTLP